ncbi:hypothetical protein [Campylobacter showae]
MDQILVNKFITNLTRTPCLKFTAPNACDQMAQIWLQIAKQRL